MQTRGPKRVGTSTCTVQDRALEIGSRGAVGPISESGCEIRQPVGPISILKKLCHEVKFSSAKAAKIQKK